MTCHMALHARLCGPLTTPPHFTTGGYALYYVGSLESIDFLPFLDPSDFFPAFRGSHFCPSFGTLEKGTSITAGKRQMGCDLLLVEV